jgi:hypothetical protein
MANLEQQQQMNAMALEEMEREKKWMDGLRRVARYGRV